MTHEQAVSAMSRFCPRCRAEALNGEPLCPACGDLMRDQGYCPVCERSWRLEVGESCPKHETELEEQPAPVIARFPADRVQAWRTVATFDDPLRAEPPRLRLEAEGIPTLLDGERMGGVSMYQVATGGVRLQVPENLQAEARVLLAQRWSEPLADDLDEAWDELGPEPGASSRSLMKVMIFFFLFAPGTIAAIAWLMREH